MSSYDVNAGYRNAAVSQLEAWRADMEQRKSTVPRGGVHDTPPAGRPALASREFNKGQLFGRYRIEEKLGAGGMGTVYLAYDTKLERQVALKIPRFDPDDGREIIERFHREARAAATLNHPNLCPVYDVGEIDGVPFLAMAYIEGRPLSHYVRSKKPPEQRQVALAIKKIALALEEAHQRGVIHRDLKPSNIMINQRREPVIMDFGLAQRTTRRDARLTDSGMLLGTPAYMPPEQVHGDLAAMGPRCDIYSLGVIMYEMLTGRLPFEGPPISVIAQLLTQEPAPASSHRPDLDPQLDLICLKAMAKELEKRYASMSEFATALGSFLSRAKPSHLQPYGAANHVTAAAPADLSLFGQPALDANQPASDPPHMLTVNPCLRLWRRMPRWHWTSAGITTAGILLLGIVLLVHFMLKRGNNDALRAELTPTTANGAGHDEATESDAQPTLPDHVVPTLEASAIAPRGYALRLDGRKGVVRIPKSSFKFYGDHSLTIEATVIPQEYRSSPQQVVCDIAGSYKAGSAGLALHLLPERKWAVAFASKKDWCTATNDAEVALNTPVRLAAVYDRQRKELRLFVDGKLNNALATNVRFTASDWATIIGADPNNPGNRYVNLFAGVVQQLRISRIARYSSDFEPEPILNADKDTLVLYYFDEGSGQVVHDRSGREGHARVENAQWLELER